MSHKKKKWSDFDGYLDTKGLGDCRL